MLIQPCVRSNFLFSKVLYGSVRRRFNNFTCTSLFQTLNVKLESRTCSMASNQNIDSDIKRRRNYQVVVAATREMGIGKDGKLPWRLPSDLKFFKEITVTTSEPGKKNAVVMGRKTWESIPYKYRPLPGRLNVVLSRCGSLGTLSDDNVIVCGSILSALELLARSPYCSSVEKVFVIGGGQILREALNAAGCEAIHVTEIETDVECDTFIPAIDQSMFQLLHSSKLMTENGIRFSLVTYVRRKDLAAGTSRVSTEVGSDGSLNHDKLEAKNFTFLPKVILDKLDVYK